MATTDSSTTKLHMLTTTDNPFDPFTQYDQWHLWDAHAGYHTPSLLARVVITSDELSEADQDDAIEIAIQEIVDLNPLGIYRAVESPD